VVVIREIEEAVLSCLLQVGMYNRYNRGLKAEKMAMRNAIYPVIQAEEDRR
jgi:hypothetical protein